MPTGKQKFRILAVCHEPRSKKSPVDFYEALKDSPAWCKYFQSVWLIATKEPPAELWKRIEKHLDKKDYLLIVEVNKYVGFLPKAAWDWIEGVRKADA